MEIYEVPYHVHLDYNDTFACGGTIISTLAILTAAHCLTKGSIVDLKVVAGDYNLEVNDGTEQFRNVSRFIIHEGYNETTLENDMAVVYLDTPLVLNEHVQSIRLPRTLKAFSGGGTVSRWRNEGNNMRPWTPQKMEPYPAVYTDVSKLTKWASKSLKQDKASVNPSTTATILYAQQNHSETLRFVIHEGQCVNLRLLDDEHASIITRNTCVSVYRYQHSDCRGRVDQFFTWKFGRDQLYRNTRGSEGQFRSISIRKC